MSIARFGPYSGRALRAAGIGFGVLSAASFGTSGSFADALMSTGWSPGAVVTVRIAVAALVLTPFALVQLRGRWSVLRGAAGLIVGYGLFAVATAQLAFFYAVRHLDVGVALLIEYSGIVLVVLWLWIRHGRTPRPLTVAGVVAAITGLVLVLGPSGGLDLVGVLWAAFAATGLAVYFVISSKADTGVPPLVVAWGGMVTGALTLLAFGLVGLMPVRFAGTDVELFGRATSWLVPVIGLSVIAAAVSYSAGIVAARLLGPQLASFLGLTEVLFAVAFAALLVGQVPTLLQALGGLVVLTGVALVHAADRTTEAAPVGEAQAPLEPVTASRA